MLRTLAERAINLIGWLSIHVAKEGAKVVSENPNLLGGALGAIIGATALVYTNNQSNEVAREGSIIFFLFFK